MNIRPGYLCQIALAAVIALSSLSNFSVGAKNGGPLKLITPDLSVQSVEFGKFPKGLSPNDVGVSRARFIPTTEAGEHGFWYGYRVVVNTNRTRILLRDTSDVKTHVERGDQGTYVKPVDGVVYKCWDIVDGFPAGKHWIQVWIENKKLPRLNYNVAH